MIRDYKRRRRRLQFNLSLTAVLLLLSFFRPSFSQVGSQPVNYREIFGIDYENAEKTILEHSWWKDTLIHYGADPRFALSIVFPELIRYSSISDYIEVKALEVLYVQYGQDYADFSIGPFQMKPTFAEQIEADLVRYGLDETFQLLISGIFTTEYTEVRKERVIRLKDERFQLLYLAAFVAIMEKKYLHLSSSPEEEWLLFCSTAYNTGYFKEETVIREEMKKCRFYCGMTGPDIKYAYGRISLQYYLSTLK